MMSKTEMDAFAEKEGYELTESEKEEIIETVQYVVSRVKEIWQAIVDRVRAFCKEYKEFLSLNERPKQATSIQDYLELKKKSEPFYKSADSKRKPWQ